MATSPQTILAAANAIMQMRQLLYFAAIDETVPTGVTVEIKLQNPQRQPVLFVNSLELRPFLMARFTQLKEELEAAGVDVRELIADSEQGLVAAGIFQRSEYTSAANDGN